MEYEEETFIEWVKNLTIGEVVTQLMLILFAVLILVFVVRAFKNKPSA